MNKFDSFLALVKDAEYQISTFKKPTLPNSLKLLLTPLVRLEAYDSRKFEIVNLYITDEFLHLTVSWEAKGCNDYQAVALPTSIFHFEDPLTEFKKILLEEDIDRLRRNIDQMRIDIDENVAKLENLKDKYQALNHKESENI